MGITAIHAKIEDLLRSRIIYSVPIFQRSYSWGDKEINDFLEDLESVYKNKDEEYFFGSMVFAPHEEENKIKILDGQQRLATIMLFLAAMRDVLKSSPKDENIKRAVAINELIYSTDPVTLSKKIKIELNMEDRSFFEAIITQGIVPEAKYSSHRLIQKAYKRFQEYIREKIQNDEKFAENALDIILSKFIVIKIEVESDVNAHSIFETLNDRGLELSIADLLKNYIFSLSGPYLSEVIYKWREMIDNIGDHTVSKFLRHYWCSTKELVRKEEVYKKVKNSIKTAEEARNFMNQLNEEGLVYSNMVNPTHEFWVDKEVEDLLNELNILGAEQALIILLAIYKRFFKQEKENFKKLLRSIVNFTFRYSTICNLNPNEMEKLYSGAALKLRNNEWGFEEIIKKLKEYNPDDKIFCERFLEKDIKNTKLAKYILVKLNNYLLMKRGGKEITTNINRVNLEHIIPKRPDKEWEKFLKENNIELEKWVHKLGNMTILLKEYNRKISNKFFTRKKEMYLKSALPINQELKVYEKFGPNEIIERQKKMAEIAKEIWKV
jgi:uncharacterized protein with ParB-like and HNH nuclease domain